VAAGETLILYLDDERGRLPDDLELRQTGPDRRASSLSFREATLQDRSGESRNVAAISFTPSAGTHRLDASGGDDDRLPPLTLISAAPPSASKFDIVVSPPPYSRLPEQQSTSSVAHLRGLVGSTARITGVPNEPITRGRITFESGVSQDLAIDPAGHFTVEIPIREEGRRQFWFELFDDGGLTHPNPPRYELVGDPDQKPTVALQQPAEDVQVTANARLPYRIEIRDDLGVAAARLELRGKSTAPDGGPAALHLRTLDATSDAGQPLALEGSWPLEELSLQPGQQWELQAIASDHAPADSATAREGKSAVRVVTILSADDARQRLIADERTLSEQLDQLKSAVERDLAALREIRAGWRAGRQLDRASLEALSRMSDSAEAAARRIESPTGLRARLEAMGQAWEQNRLDEGETKSRLSNVENLTQRVSEMQSRAATTLREMRRHVDLNSGTNAAGKDVITPSPDEAAAVDESLASAEARERESSQSLAAAAELMTQQAERADLEHAFERILSQQDELRTKTAEAGQDLLSKSPADLTPQNRSDVGRLAEQQRQIAEAFQGLAEAAGRPASDPSDSSEASPLPPGLNATGVSELMRSAADSLDAFQLGAAIENQKTLEEMLRGLREQMQSEHRDDEQLVKALEDAGRDLETLQQEQAEWRRAVSSLPQTSSADPELREHLAELQKRQRDSSESAAEFAQRLQRTAPEAARHVDSAATEIDRSAELLEDNQSPAALERVRQAEEHLKQAADAIARRRQDVKEQRQFAAYEQARSAAAALAARQKSLREETARLDEIVRKEGKLSRSQLRTLRQLVDDQGALAGDSESSAGDAPDEVTRWAFTAAARAMRTVAGRLDERQIDTPVQESQSRIERQLAAIESSLALDPPSSDSPETPSDDEADPQAEENPSELVWLAPQLELLRQMQLDLIDRTTRLKQAPPDDPELEAAAREVQADQQHLAELAAALLSAVSGEPSSAANDRDELTPNPQSP
jgi:hypothetical protein